MPPLGDSELLTSLGRGVEVWNAQRPDGWISLADFDLNDLDLRGVDLSHAGMWGCNFQRTDLSGANLQGADLTWANMCRARLIQTKVADAVFDNAWIYGAAIWDLEGVPRGERDISIVPDDERYWTSDRRAFHLAAGGLRMAAFLSAAYSSIAVGGSDNVM